MISKMTYTIILTKSQEELPKSLMAEINLGCTSGDEEHTYRVYVTTYLGYGANAARKTYEKIIYQRNKEKTTILDPCLPVSMKQNISGLIFIGSGKYDECYGLVRTLLNETVDCPKVNSENQFLILQKMRQYLLK